MQFAKDYDIYTRLEIKIRDHKNRGFLHRRILSLPARIRRRFYRNKIRKAVAVPVELRDLRTDGDPAYIVSLTSFPRRLAGLPSTLRSLFMQDTLPGSIILWLCEEELEGLDKSLPQLDEFRAKGLKVRFVEDNIKPHLKYFHAVREFPDKNIITVDDDLIYQPDTISRLIGLSRQFPGAVCANRVREMVIGDGAATPYSSWPNRTGSQAQCSGNFIALGYGGVLYPPGGYRIKFADKELLTELSPLADDLWLKAVEICEGVPVATGEIFVHPVTVVRSQEVTLLKNNVSGTGNDTQWRALDNYFGLTKKLVNVGTQ